MARSGCRILLVDDHPDSVLFLSKLLRHQGHTVLTADSCEAAREIAAAESLDLLISDIGLPDGSGCDLMSELKATRGLRGIALSGRALPEDLEASQRAGFSEHLIKPVAMEAVTDAIRRLTDCAS